MKNFLYIIPILGILIYVSLHEKTQPITTIDISPPQPSELYDKYKNSVVMVYNEYYYAIEVGSGVTYYYSPDSEYKFYTTIDMIEENLSGGTGTGFFVSDKGELITNRHVVMPEADNFIDDYYAFKSFITDNFVNELKFIEDTLRTISDIGNRIDVLDFDSIPSNLTQELIMTMQSKLSSKFSDENLLLEPSITFIKDLLEEEYKEQEDSKSFIENVLSTFQDLFDTHPNYIEPEYINQNIGIVFNGATGRPEDIQPCRIVKISKDAKVDLALIKTTGQPNRVSDLTVFDFAEHNPNIIASSTSNIKNDLIDPVGIDDEVFIIAFNAGLDIGITSKGLQAQFTKGNISQNPDKNRIMYTIPVLPGSSGSPVMDKWGNLIAVNFASAKSSPQSFNYGIPVYKLYEFLNGKLVN